MKIKHKDTELLPGLELQSREEGVWLMFDVANKKGCINLSDTAKESSPTVGEPILEWLKIYATC